MSDTANARRKVSREGLELIKSLQGFRPGAVRDGDGRWRIGYGHTASAREGQSIGETEAELLLQYDLLPIVNALNTLDLSLNSRQFDALASFGLSLGVERFLASTSLSRMSAGERAEAADAMLAVPAPVAADEGLRRRAVERAWFSSDPERPVSLQRLMTAPIPVVGPLPADGETVEAAPVAPGVIKHETGADPVRFDWSEAGMYVVMGLLGLTACAFSAAAFRLAYVTPRPNSEPVVIAWALAVTGVTCVAVAAWNLYAQSRRA